MKTPFYLLVIRYNFRNRTREKAQDLLKAAQPSGNMKAHGAIFARGAHARRPTPERSGFHDQNSHCPMLFHALGRVYFLPYLQGKTSHADIPGDQRGKRGPILPQVQARACGGYSAGDRPGPCDPAGNQRRSRLTGPADHPPCLDGVGTAGHRTGGRTFSDGGRERRRG